MMHGRGKSNSAIVAVKLVNKAGRLAAESVDHLPGSSGIRSTPTARSAVLLRGNCAPPEDIEPASRRRQRVRQQ